ncbi:MAG: LytTR family DNA-binding domain-containing protein [Flavobacteriaceae bacterium]|jgi:two-component system LytT family response regulator|nr:LytTR family DNA-binding domain-containing protein [Flavobacteriaceae bacterium]
MKVYVLEDEKNILSYIVSLLVDIPYVQLVGCSGELSKARKEIQEQQPDLILADIQLKDGNSFALLQELEEVKVIFITAFNHYAIQALNIGAFAYLLKPIDEQEFKETIERCYQKQEQFKYVKQQAEVASNYMIQDTVKRIALRNFDYTQIVCIDDIIYCQSDKGYTTFYLKDGNKIMVSKVLKEYVNLLPEQQFIRCHQSYLVNVNYISKYFKEGSIELLNKQLIPVSERKKEVIVEYIQKMM